MNKTLRSGTREVIYEVFMRCLAEFQAGRLLTQMEDVYKRTADLTGKSESTVRRIVSEGSKTKGKFSTPAKHRKGRPRKLIIRVGEDSSSSESESESEDSCLPCTSRQDSPGAIDDNMSGVEYLDVDMLD